MKITIDTKEDSHSEIKKIIRMLSSLVGEEVMTNQGDVFGDDKSEEQSPNMLNMFDSADQTKTEEDKEEKKEDVDLGIPKMDEYD